MINQPPLPKERNLDDIEKKKEQLQNQMKKSIDVKFSQQRSNYLEEEFKKHTIGLVTREEFVQKHKNIDVIVEDKEKKKQEIINQQIQQNIQKRKLIQQKQLNLLSFDEDAEGNADSDKTKNEKQIVITEKIELNDNEEQGSKDQSTKSKVKLRASNDLTNENDENNSENESQEKIAKKIRCLGKNPNIDTSFLPDKIRDQQEKIKKEQLRQQYLQIKHEKMEQFVFVNVSYWDGFNIIKQIKCKQKTQIWDFANQALKALETQYYHLSKLNAEDVYVIIKGDTVGSRLSFFDIIILEMHTKRGDPYFNFKEVNKIVDNKSQLVLEDDQTIILIIEKHKFDKQKFVYQGINTN